MNTEDKFYFGKSEQKTKFGSDTRAVNRQARMWLSQANNAGADEGLEQFHARLIKRLAEIIKSTDELIRNPKKEEDHGGWSYDDLEKELLSVAPHSNVARRWLQSNLRGGRFSRPGQPERFGLEDAKPDTFAERKTISRKAFGKTWVIKGYRFTSTDRYEYSDGEIHYHGFVPNPKNPPLVVPATLVVKPNGGRKLTVSSFNLKETQSPTVIDFSHSGQPERFGLEDACWEGYEPVGTKQKDGRTVPNCVPKDENAGPERFAASGWQTIEAYMQVLAEEFGTPRSKEAAQVMMRAAESLGGNAPAALRTAIRTAATSKNATDRGRAIGQIEDMLESASFSRPGQPDKFDASSLDRGNFAEASQSPMLGKLLAAKVMPEGGWRAVQVGSDTLVISFEDADLASDFGRRVATKGYNATSPVQAIGRYWNVEVKNGK